MKTYKVIEWDAKAKENFPRKTKFDKDKHYQKLVSLLSDAGVTKENCKKEFFSLEPILQVRLRRCYPDCAPKISLDSVSAFDSFNPKLIAFGELAKAFGVKESTLYSWCLHGFPVISVDSELCFHSFEVAGVVDYGWFSYDGSQFLPKLVASFLKVKTCYFSGYSYTINPEIWV